MKTNKTYEKYSKMIAAQYMDETSITFFRKAIGLSSSLAPELRAQLLEEFMYQVQHDNHIQISSQQSVKGILWLKDWAYTKGYKVRKQAIEHEHGERIIAVINNFEKFEFIGLHSNNPNRNFWDNWYHPIYRCISKNGLYFDYVPPFYTGKMIVTSVGKL